MSGSGGEALAWSSVVVTGPDAAAFLQGQVTQDLDGLVEPRSSLLLEPDSVVIAPTWVHRTEDGLALVLESALGEVARARLARFRLRVRADLTLLEGVAGPFATSRARLEARWPGAPEMGRGLTPHGLGRRVLTETVSFTKGCFTGQELVGRLDARAARVPWRLVVVAGPDLDAVAAVLAGAGPAGPQGVTTAIETAEGVTALAVAHRSLAAGAHGDVLVEEMDGEVASAG